MGSEAAYIWRNRYGTYYFRWVIPDELRPVLGNRRELKRSLRTESRKTAVKRARAYRVDVDQLLDTWMGGKRKQFSISELITLRNVTLPNGARVEQLNIDDPSSDLKKEQEAASELLTAQAQATVSTTSTSAVLSELINDYCDEHVRLAKWTPKTEQENRAIYALFTEILPPDTPVAELTRSSLAECKRKLLRVPSNRNKDKRYRDLTIEQILAIDNVKPMATNTINKHLNRLSSLFEWAERHGYIDSNPAKGLSIGRDKRPRAERDAFTGPELKALFESEEYQKPKAPYQYWVPLIGLYSGLRIEEICRLHLDNLRQQEGIWIFDVHEREDSHLKTRSAERIVPIHKNLLDLGILDYKAKIAAIGDDRLFPELTHQRDGYSPRVSKWFNRYRKRHGITAKSKVFHSLRHTVATYLKENGAQREQVAAILGHADGSMTFGRYGKAYSAKALKPLIDSLEFGLNHKPYEKYEGLPNG